MPRRRFSAALALPFALALAAAPAAADSASFTPQQEEEIGRIVRDYLLENPEVLVEVLQELERRRTAGQQEQQLRAVAENYDQLARDPGSPVLGNPEGDILVVEFFDYNCGYCRRMTQDLFDLAESDGGIRLVMKELPIFGEGSRFAAKAALAAEKQGKYKELHVALMGAGMQIDQAATLAIAEDLGLDMERLQADMLDPALDQALERNYALARALAVEGTPAIVIGERFIPGAQTEAQMARIVAEERRKRDAAE